MESTNRVEGTGNAVEETAASEINGDEAANCGGDESANITPSIKYPQHRKNFTLETKIEAVNRYLQVQNVSQVAREFNCSRSQIRDWCKLQDRIFQTAMTGTQSERKRLTSLKPREWWPELEEELYTWYLNEMDTGRQVSNATLLAQARSLALGLGIGDFKGSDAWVCKFKLRHDIKNRRPTFENNEENLEASNFDMSNNTELNDSDDKYMFEDKDVTINQLRGELVNLSLENSNLRFENTNYSFENANLVTENSNLKAKIDMQAAQIEQLRSQFSSLQQHFNRMISKTSSFNQLN